jgi:serine/threonine-protein kinase
MDLDVAMRSLGDRHRLGRFELLLPVARGGMGVVWAARPDDGDDELVAVKTLLPALSADPRFERMFLAEAERASRIRHPNVCAILERGEERGELYLVMEWIDGVTLHALAADAGGKIPFGIAARIALDAALGLHAAHELTDDAGCPVGLVHRDVSPHNILVSEEGRAKVSDFGVAKASDGKDALSEAGFTKGRARYMAPEQAYFEEIDRRRDIFALGAVLYEVTTGKHPFEGPTELAVLAKITSHEPPPAPSSVVKGYPLALAQVIERALAKDPSERYPTMAEMAVALTRAMASLEQTSAEDVAAFVARVSGERVAARRAAIGASRTSRATPPRKRARRAVAWIAAFACVGALALGFSGVAALGRAAPVVSSAPVAESTPALTDVAIAATAATAEPLTPQSPPPATAPPAAASPPRPLRVAAAVQVPVAPTASATVTSKPISPLDNPAIKVRD